MFLFAVFISFLSADDNFWKVVKEKKLYKMGDKIYHDRCKKVEFLDLYVDIKDLEKDLKEEYCKDLSEKRIKIVAQFLWDNYTIKPKTTIKVHQDEKCPVCGMFVYKYPRWVAQIWFKDGSHLSFDGVKDLTKYIHSQKKLNIDKILVTDYYKQYAIDGKKAFYVIGSDVYGPMGEEAIPFEEINDAKAFLKDHRGKKIVKFEEIELDDK
jgi:nitrous oxide reductase accessory protein NosL